MFKPPPKSVILDRYPHLKEHVPTIHDILTNIKFKPFSYEVTKETRPFDICYLLKDNLILPEQYKQRCYVESNHNEVHYLIINKHEGVDVDLRYYPGGNYPATIDHQIRVAWSFGCHDLIFHGNWMEFILFEGTGMNFTEDIIYKSINILLNDHMHIGHYGNKNTLLGSINDVMETLNV